MEMAFFRAKGWIIGLDSGESMNPPASFDRPRLVNGFSSSLPMAVL